MREQKNNFVMFFILNTCSEIPVNKFTFINLSSRMGANDAEEENFANVSIPAKVCKVIMWNAQFLFVCIVPISRIVLLSVSFSYFLFIQFSLSPNSDMKNYTTSNTF